MSGSILPSKLPAVMAAARRALGRAITKRSFHISVPRLARYDASQVRGFDFDFRWSNDISSAALVADVEKDRGAVTTKIPIHELRRLGFAKMRKDVAADAASQSSESVKSVKSFYRTSKASRHHLDQKANDINAMLEEDAQGKLEPRWLEIAPDDHRDRILRRVLDDANIRRLWIDIVNKSGAKEKPKATNRDGSVSSTAKLNAPQRKTQDEKALEIAIAELCTAFRAKLRSLSGLYEETNDDGWGSCLPHGQYKVRNLESADKEGNKPDVAFFCRAINRAEEPKGPDWADLLSTLGVKLHARQDLSPEVTSQCFQHARKLVQYHPVCTRSHQITLSGTLVRLWQFQPTLYATTRAHSFANAEDELAIAQVLALFTAGRPDSILRQWAPSPSFEICRDGRIVEQWQWIGRGPKFIKARPELWGSRTTIFAGPARLVRTASPAVEQNRAKVDLDGSKSPSGWMTLVKCSLVPQYLIGHEHQMQAHIVKKPGTPAPIGNLVVDVPPSAAPSDDSEGSKPRHVYALAYQHFLGTEVPDDLAEIDLCRLFEQPTRQLRSFSRSGAHYRDLNAGNLLCRLVKGQPPRLLLVDHGNMRLDGEPRGRHEPREPRSVHAFFKIAEEDTRSANPAFLPSSMFHAETALRCLRSAEVLWSASPSPERLEDVEQHRRQLLLYTHSHIDDLESSCYVHLWFGLCRSFEQSAEEHKTFERELTSLASKCVLWENRVLWQTALATYCPRMSAAWRRMMEQKRDIIYAAQQRRREELRASLALGASDPSLGLSLSANDPSQIFKVSKGEVRCFIEITKLYKASRGAVSSKPFEL